MAIGSLITFNVTGLTINDSTTVSESFNLNPFDIWGRIVDLQVILHGLTHTFPDDLDFLLVGPGGATLEFWSDAGGNIDISNGNFTICGFRCICCCRTQAAIASGTYRPADYGFAEHSSNWGLPPSIIVNHPAPNGTATLDSVFGGACLRAGNWRLFVRDDGPAMSAASRVGAPDHLQLSS